MNFLFNGGFNDYDIKWAIKGTRYIQGRKAEGHLSSIVILNLFAKWWVEFKSIRRTRERSAPRKLAEFETVGNLL